MSLNKRYQSVIRGRVWTGLGSELAFIEDGVVEITTDRIHDVREASESDSFAELDQYGNPYTFLPGFVDLHNHGGAGHSFPTSDAAGCSMASEYHRSRGTTTMLASLVSAVGSHLVAQSSVLAEVADAGVIAGIHLEGPFLSPDRCGAQEPAAIVPGDPELLLDVIHASRGHLRSVTIAPEAGRYADLLRICVDHNVVVSLGHSNASAVETDAALTAAAAAGAVVTATHLFNGMPALHHRDPGIAGVLFRAAAQGNVVAELVADGIHLDDSMVDLVVSAAPENVAFVSDAMAAAGMNDGDYTLGSASVSVRDGVARLSTPQARTGAIAGGTSSLLDQVLRHAGGVLLQSSREQQASHINKAARLLRACTVIPARVLGLEDRGQLNPGMRADIVRLDSRGRVAGVLIGGDET